jgi:hypothetical protein
MGEQMDKYAEYKAYPTRPGWYCIGWDREDQGQQVDLGPDFGEILYFDGSEWSTEDERAVEYLLDPLLQCRVAMDAADYYVLQNS